MLPKAITAMSSNPRNLEEVRKVLNVWEQRHVNEESTIDEVRKICDTMTQVGVRSDQASIQYIVSLANSIAAF